MSKKTKAVRISSRRSLRETIAVLPVSVRSFGIFIVSVAATGIAAYQALSMVRADPRLVFSAEGVDVRGLPPWLDAESAARLRAASLLPVRIHALDRAPLAKLNEYYLKNEWVASVECLEYIMPGGEGGGGIVGRLRLREPLCLVGLASGEYYFADAEGRRLGGSIRTLPPADLRLPVIQCASRVPPRGEAWGARREHARADEGVLHGFYMAALLSQAGLRAELPHWVAQIDVRSAGSRRSDWSEVRLVTEPGHEAVLHWGRTARSEVVHGNVQEAPTGDKLERLRQILSGARPCEKGEEVLLFEPVARRQAGGPWLSAARP